MAKNKTIGEEINEQDEIQEDRDALEDERDEETGPDEQELDDEQDDEPLGEAGKRALERERKARKDLEKELKEYKRQNESDHERELREAREEAANEAAGEWKTRFVKAEARSALVAAGLTKAQDRMLSLIDLDEIEVDEDGDVVGLDAQIEELKTDFPELFERKARRTKGDTGDKPAASTPKSIGEQLAAQLGR